jgi:hypothetical protein
VVSLLASMEEGQQCESTSCIFVFLLSSVMLPHCTKIEMVCLYIKLGDWLWITLREDKGFFLNVPFIPGERDGWPREQ